MTLPDLLRELRIPFREPGHHHVRAGNIGIDCFQCSPNSGRFRLGIHLTRLVCNCWVCGSIRLGDALAGASGEPIRTVLGMLAGFAPRLPQTGDDTPRGTYRPPDGTGPLMPVHRDYLAGRGVDPDAAAGLYSVGGIGLTSRLKWRLFLPVIVDGKPVSWTTRAIGDRVGLRYVSASPSEESLPLKSTLFGEHLAGNSVIVTEGPLDALRIGPGAVATYGLNVTRAQTARLARYARVAVCFDNEAGAQRRAAALCDALAAFGASVFRVCVGAKDPGIAPRSEIRELRRRFLD